MSKGIRCGNHGFGSHVYHATAAEVRECFAGRYDFDDQADQDRRHSASFGPDREQPTIWPEDPTVALNAQTQHKNDGWQKTSIKLDHVWEGAYAITDPGDGRLRFLEVDRPDEGKWNGFIFVKVRASDELHKLGSVNPKYGTYAGKAVALVRALADKDEAGLRQAAIRFGLEIGECGFCRRSLTDDEGDVNSRTLGYGPICAWRHGLPHPKARPPSH